MGIFCDLINGGKSPFVTDGTKAGVVFWGPNDGTAALGIRQLPTIR